MTGDLTKHAKSLRSSSTEVEKLLWNRLKTKQVEGVKFRRPQPIGNFIVDFVSFENRLVIELDGGQHANNSQRDIERDEFLAKRGFRVLRFWNNEVVEDVDGVMEVIRRECLK